MATRSQKDLKVKAKKVKIPHLTNVNKKKMEAWGLGELFADEWSQAHEDLVEELAVLAPVRLKHFQHNQLAFYHYAWLAITDPTAPTLDWGDAVEKTMNNEKMKEPKKWKVREQSISDIETEMEEEKETKGEFPNATWIGEASKSKPLDMKMAVDFNKWKVLFHNLGRETSKLLRLCT
ncbi:hypothetical protein R1flu_012433 [Riccia fluitans]|uniref:Uncharacterized protein n=1 Tax=Riccia fluitans TaxID=41844 RepID=A0ABD1ZAQ4_9MARC